LAQSGTIKDRLRPSIRSALYCSIRQNDVQIQHLILARFNQSEPSTISNLDTIESGFSAYRKSHKHSFEEEKMEKTRLSGSLKPSDIPTYINKPLATPLFNIQEATDRLNQ
jgi:hypothetical protein